MKGDESLRGMFNITPGLTIAQEKHLVNFIYTYISSAIDIKYESKVKKADVMKEATKAFTDIVAPSEAQVKQMKEKLSAIQGNPQVDAALEQINSMINTFESIKKNWSDATIQASMEKEGVEYAGEVGLLEKAMLEISKTSDIKEKQDKEIESPDEEVGQESDENSLREKSYEDNARIS